MTPAERDEVRRRASDRLADHSMATVTSNERCACDRCDDDRAVLRYVPPGDAGGQTGPVGKLLGSHAIVEWYAAPDWYQARIAQHRTGTVKGADLRWRHENARGWSSWGQPWGRPGRHMDQPARLVPAAEADADPNQRGPLLAATAPVCPGPDCPMCNGEACDKCNPGPGRPRCDHDGQERHEPPTATPRCSCTHEAGDSRCDAHPTCSECGATTPRPVDGCDVCRGPLPKGG